MTPELVAPSTDLYAAWLRAHREWGPGLHEDGFGLRAADKVDTAGGFSAWVTRLNEHATIGDARCTYRWIVEAGQVLGGIALRHGEGEFVQRAGHIGYGITPSARGRGLAGWALGRILEEARALGMDRVLLICAADNIASARTIERHHGVLERIEDTDLGPARRYRITIDRTPDV